VSISSTFYEQLLHAQIQHINEQLLHVQIPKAHKKTAKSSGSMRVKSARKMLMKLTPEAA